MEKIRMYPFPYPAMTMPESRLKKTSFTQPGTVYLHSTLVDLIPEGQSRHRRSSGHVHVALNLLQVDKPVAAAAKLPNVNVAGIVTRRQNLIKIKVEPFVSVGELAMSQARLYGWAHSALLALGSHTTLVGGQTTIKSIFRSVSEKWATNQSRIVALFTRRRMYKKLHSSTFYSRIVE